MMNDPISSYRTKFPPKEHEDAVRMLLESTAGKRATAANHSSHPQKVRDQFRKPEPANNNNNIEYEDRSSINSVNTSSDSRVESDQGTNMHSKATSTTSDCLSSAEGSSADQEAIFREPIPSRTIAIQCDLKSSSLKRDQVFDGASMQASSISATRFGFYNFSPETLQSRRKLQQSISSRDFDDAVSKQQASRAHQQRQPVGIVGQQIGALTSTSEISSDLSASDAELDNVRRAGSRMTDNSNRFHTSQHHNSRNRLRNGCSTGAISMHDSMEGTLDGMATARARVDTLPRRPMTALSYVSTNKLRGSKGSSYSSSEGSCEKLFPRSSMKSRALSQQALGEKGAQTQSKLVANHLDADLDCDSNSETELKDNDESENFYSYQVPRSEEIVLTKRGLSVPAKPPRPTLIASMHNEQVKDLRAPPGERAPVLSQIRKPSLQMEANNNSAFRANGSLAQQDKSALAYDGAQRSRAFDCDEELISKANSTDDRSWQPMAGRNHKEGAHNLDYRTGQQALNSMSLSRRPKLTSNNIDTSHRLSQDMDPRAASGAHQSALIRQRPSTLSHTDRAYSKTLLLPKSSANRFAHPSEDIEKPRRRAPQDNSNPSVDVYRSMSMRQISRPMGGGRHEQSVYTNPANQTNDYRQSYEHEMNYSKPTKVGQDYYGGATGRRRTGNDQSGDSESSATRTWANPGAGKQFASPVRVQDDENEYRMPMQSGNRRSTRSFSMRDVNNLADSDQRTNGKQYAEAGLYYRNQENSRYLAKPYRSGSDSSSIEHSQRFIRSDELDYDSQHRLNESGLPDVSSMAPTPIRRPSEGAASYLGVSSRDFGPGLAQYGGSNGSHHQRPARITGRAMSQQSLTRPTMPLSTGRRRTGGGGSNSGSDIGGSSMSLVSRLHGRYENAHTRSPVVMYIPQATPKSSIHGSSSAIAKSSTLRKSSRTKLRAGAQDRSRRSSSRNGSDSESSSMLRTLVKPRNRVQGSYASSRRRGTMVGQLHDDDEEDMDGVGQLATEVDSYKFNRRYSVPKDAKINWFAKLKQRVSSNK